MNKDSTGMKFYGQHQLLFLNILIASIILGIYAAQISPVPHKYLFLSLAVNFIAAFILTLRQSRFTFIFFIALFFIIGFARTQSVLNVPADSISRFAGQSITVRGIVDEEVRVQPDGGGGQKISFAVSVQSVKALHGSEPASGRIYIYARPKGSADMPQIGDEISCSGTLRPIRGYQNPGQIDRTMAARQQGIEGSLSAGKKPLKILQKADDSFSFKKFSSEIRQNLLTSLQKAMPPEDAGLIFAMLFGGYSGITPELLEAFTVTGIVHILSVSGSHISLLAGFILNTGRLFRLPRRLSFIILFLVIAFYALLCGFTPPVLRAAAMGLLSAGALTLGRVSEARRLLSITALIMLLIDPLLAFSISFQLSFASTAGLVYIMPKLKKLFRLLPRFIADNAALTLSAQLAVLPLTAWYFNSLPLSSVPANLIAVPPLEFVIILGLLGSLIGVALPFVQHLIFIAASLALGAASDITAAIAALPMASIYMPTLSPGAAFCYYSALFVILNDSLRCKAAKYIRQFKYPAAIGLMLAMAFAVCYRISEPEMMQVHFIDVGQGDAALIVSPSGRAAMIDTGGTLNSDFDVGRRVDLPYLRHYGITELDYLILSHKDADHAGGAASILKNMPVHHLIISGEDKNDYAEVLRLPPDSPVLQNSIAAKEGMAFSLDGIDFKILYSGEGSGNDASNVIKLTYHDFSVLFTGDISQSGESELLKKQHDLQSTVLKTAHHGSKTSSSDEFLRAVQPRFAVISAGLYNSFGHPHEEVLRRLEALPAEVLRTDESGAVVFITDGRKMTVDTHLSIERNET